MPYIGPQPGPQEMFLSSSADICVYGGAAGGGKSFALELESIRHIDNPRFGAVIFRRTFPEIKAEGGLWDESYNIFPYVGGKARVGDLKWLFPSSATVTFAHMQHEKDRYKWQGTQIPLICFDELNHFSEAQFFYMVSRNRSTCGVKPYIRASTNPDPDSWVKRFLGPWVDELWPEEDRAKSGEIRWFVREGDNIVWLKDKSEHPFAKSVSFVAASVYDNKILLETNPEYLANLHALPLVERLRLLEGNWAIRASGNKFKREWFDEILDVAPADLEMVVRAWDRAGTEPKKGNKDPDWTVGIKIGKKHGLFYILDVIRVRMTPLKVDELIKQTAILDGPEVIVLEEEEPGSTGVAQIARDRVMLAGYDFHGVKSTGNKELRANPVSAQAEGHNIKLIRGLWIQAFLNELAAFPTAGVHDDQVDAMSLAFTKLFEGMNIPLGVTSSSTAVPGPRRISAATDDKEEQARLDYQQDRVANALNSLRRLL